MKKLILLLLTALLLALPAWAEGPEETHILTTPDGLSVTHTVNGSPYRLYSDAELLMQHYCTMGEYDKAFVLNEQLSALGDAKATYRLGCHYLSGQGVPRDETAALDCFTTAKEAGNEEAALALILMKLNGWGIPQDTLGATAELTACAQEGRFQHELALLYLHGVYDVPAHEATAMHWFEQYCGAWKEMNPDRYDQALTAFLASSPTALTDPLPVEYQGWDNPVLQANMGLALGKFWREGRGGIVDAQAAAYWYEFTAALPQAREALWANGFLADMHLSGELGRIDVEKAIWYFQQPQDPAGYGEYRIGLLYWEGVTGADGTVCLAADTAAALSWLEKATAYNPACALLGDAYRTGELVPADAHTAAHYYALGLNNSESTECYDPLLQMYQEGLLYDRAVMDEIWAGLRYWRGRDHQLATRLAEDWLNGKTAEDGTVLVQQDRKAACELMETFCDMHRHLHQEQDVFFLNWLGWFYSGNAPEAVQQDYPKALGYYIESAEQGNGYAMAMAGVFYQNGRGVPADHMTARAWYKRAIAAGYSGAQGYLDALNEAYPEYPVDMPFTVTLEDGLTLAHVINRSGGPAYTDAELYMYGCCLEEQWTTAMEINLQLAEAGDVEAMKRLAQHYGCGLGTVQDDTRALGWMRNAAAAGSDGAVFHLACAYLGGWGVAPDAPKAAAMLESLVSYGEPDAELLYLLSTLYKSGSGALAPDAEKAQQYFDQVDAAWSRRYKALHSDDPRQLKAMQDALRQEFLDLRDAFDLCTAPDARLTTVATPGPSDWEKPDYSFLADLAAFWTEGRGGRTDYAQAARCYEQLLTLQPESKLGVYPLAVIYRDGSAGYCDVQRAIRLFLRAEAYEEVAAMFTTGVTGPDGQVCLASNEIVAGAFRTWAQTPGDPEAGRRLGDLFRDDNIVTANANLAAAFYWGARENPYCADQLAALVEAGLVTDAALMEEISGTAE